MRKYIFEKSEFRNMGLPVPFKTVEDFETLSYLAIVDEVYPGRKNLAKSSAS